MQVTLSVGSPELVSYDASLRQWLREPARPAAVDRVLEGEAVVVNEILVDGDPGPNHGAHDVVVMLLLRSELCVEGQPERASELADLGPEPRVIVGDLDSRALLW